MPTDSSPATKDLLVKALRELKDMRAQLAAQRQAANEPIAVVGLACRFPGGADTPARFWDLLRDGVSAVGEVPADRWDAAAVYDPDPAAPGKIYTRLGGFIDDIDAFDPLFFGISPREAANMDPQQRLLLEVAWEALEHAGLPIESLANSLTGVFVGLASSDYSHLLVETQRPADIDAYVLTGNAPNVSAGRLAFTLGLQGPALAVDTACSSSLVVVHLACQSLRSRECDAALAAGVNLILSPASSIAFCRMNALARDGLCKTFDAAADGFIRGEGCGVVVLKRLADAVAAGNQVLAVIRGSAVNQDGRTSALTVPNGPAQRAVIRAALARAGVAPHEVGYVEAHGTGTPLGDPIELHALAEAYERLLPGNAPPPLVVGSVKTNFGHLEAAAGIAGLIKVILALQHRAIPPHLHFHQPNPHVDWQKLALRVPTALMEWRASTGPRLAAVSAFGFSGTNAHVIVEEAPLAGPEAASGAPAASTVSADAPPHLLVFSARSEAQMRALAGRAAEWLDTTDAPLADICHASQVRRSHWNWRAALVVDSLTDLRDKLARLHAQEPVTGLYAGNCRVHSQPKVAFLFSGQGGQHVGMGAELYRSQPAFRQTFDRCAVAAAPYLDQPLAEICFNEQQAGQPFDNLVAAQVALFALQAGLASQWQSWGVEPAVVLGHSLGEFAAAVTAGVLGLEEATRLVAERARLMETQGISGGVGIVLSDAVDLQPYLDRYAGRVWRVGSSGPRAVAVAGYAEAVASLLREAEAAGLSVRSLGAFERAGYPLHTPLMEPVIAGWMPVLGQARLQPPEVDYISSCSGDLVDGELTTAEYWAAQSRQPFELEKAVATLIEQRPAFVLEIGPGAATASILRRCAPEAALTVLTSLHPKQSDHARMLTSLAQLHVGGVDVDWPALHEGKTAPPIALPLTPFIRQRYWFAASQTGSVERAGWRSDGSLGWLGRRWPSPLDAAQYSIVLQPDTFAFLPDHKIHGQVVVAAAAHLARALAAAGELSASGAAALEDVVFAHPLVLRAGAPRLCHLTWQPDGAGGAALKIASAPTNADRLAWVEHLAGRAAPRPPNTPSAADLAGLQRQCPHPASAQAFYAELDRRGYTFGPVFRWMETIQRGDGQALCRLRAPGEADQVAQSPLPPGLLDACLQSLSAIVDTEGLPLYVPYSLDQLRFYAAPSGPTWCYAVAHGSASNGGTVAGDVRLYDESGQVLLEVLGLHGRPISAEAVRQSLEAGNELEHLYFHVQWHEAAPPAPGDKPATGGWLLFDDGLGTGNALSELIRTKGAAVATVHPGDAFGQLGAAAWAVRPGMPADYARLMDEVTQAFGSSPDRIVHLWSLRAGGVSPMNTHALGAGSVHTLVQVLAARTGQASRIYAVTLGAAPGFSEQSALETWAAATLWGLGPAIAAEYPEMWGGNIGIDPQAGSAGTDALLIELLADPIEQRVVLHGGRRYVARLAAGMPAGPASGPPAPNIRPDGAYVVTGGLGALGLATAEWLASRGARHLVLLARSQPGPAAMERLARLADGGVQVVVAQADVAQADQLERALAGCRPNLPPVRGVFHLAGVLEDATLARLTAEQFRRVLEPKVAGAWNLHRATKADPLDLFVLFSSAAALLGPPGQAAYAAANAALDALAHARRAAGLPALTVDWGPWQSGGMADNGSAARWRQWGIELLPAEDALRALERALSLGVTQAAVIAWRPGAREAGLPALAAAPFFAGLLPEPALGTGPDAALLAELSRAPVGQRQAILAEALQREAIRVLALPRDTALDHAQPLNEYGLDSLMAIEMRNAVVRLVGQRLPVTLLFDYPTLDSMSRYLLETVLGTPDDPAPAAPAGSTDLEQRIAALSDEEAEAALAAQLAILRARQ